MFLRVTVSIHIVSIKLLCKPNANHIWKNGLFAIFGSVATASYVVFHFNEMHCDLERHSDKCKLMILSLFYVICDVKFFSRFLLSVYTEIEYEHFYVTLVFLLYFLVIYQVQFVSWIFCNIYLKLIIKVGGTLSNTIIWIIATIFSRKSLNYWSFFLIYDDLSSRNILNKPHAWLHMRHYVRCMSHTRSSLFQCKYISVFYGSLYRVLYLMVYFH